MPLLKLLGAETVTTVEWDTLTPIVTSITAQFSIATILGVVAGIIGAGIGFVFMWWGGRKALASILGSAKKGKVSV